LREHSQRGSTFGGRRIGADGELIGHDTNMDGVPTTVWEVGILGLVSDLGTIYERRVSSLTVIASTKRGKAGLISDDINFTRTNNRP